MLSFSLRPGAPTVDVIHYATSPVVYLDQWAWRWLAQEKGNAEQFIRLLAQSGGSLAFSELNLVEFGNVKDTGLLRQCEDLLMAARPSLAFTDFDPGAVIAREDACLATADLVSQPYLSGRLLQQLDRFDDSRLDPFSFHGVLTRTLKAPPGALRAAAALLADALKRGIEKGKAIARETPGGKKEVRAGATGLPTKWPTRYVYEAAIYYVVKSRIDLKKVNNGIDFFHMVVPMSCCDIVLLDIAWTEMTRQVQQELRGKGLLTREAKVLSPKTKEDLFSTLQTYRPLAPRASL